jgi:hypothetical protein
MDKPAIAVGSSDFKELREYGDLYVDKTPFIEELVESRKKVSLILRPRRFGKTLMLSTLRYFFSDEAGNDPQKLFAGLKIMEPGNEKAQEMMGRYPVISLTMKSIRKDSFQYSRLSGGYVSSS